MNLTAGTDADNGCSGNIPAIPRLNFPGLCVSDAGNGLVSGCTGYTGTGTKTWFREVQTMLMLGRVVSILVQGKPSR